jgi:hypothetical protein
MSRSPFRLSRPCALFVVIAAGIAASPAQNPPPAGGAAAAPANVLFVLDSSGSMWERVDGQPKIVTAKKVLNDLLAKLPAKTRVGLMTYGHRRKGDCKDIELLSAIGRETPSAIAKKVDALQPKGETPIAAALAQAADAFRDLMGPRIVVLVTDGAEECHGDPCAAAKALAAVGADVHVNVVGFHLKPKEREAVECVANAGRGKYYDAADTKALAAAMAEVKADVEQAGEAPIAEPAGTNLLSPAQGGQLIAAPNETWSKAITGKPDDTVRFSCAGLPTEAIFAFKGGKPATFSKFQILVPRSGQWAKEIELLAGDDGPAGAFRSIGRLTTQNLRVLQSPYQEVSFAETTASFFKLRILSAWSGDCDDRLTQIRLVGKLPAGAAAAIPDTSGTDLLAPAAGGQVISAPNLGWGQVITGKEADFVRFSCASLPTEAVFAFRDERPATLTRFETLIPSTGQWMKDFELSIADDLSGAFRPVGKFTTQNLRLVQGPYQEFRFAAPAAGRYVKLKILSAYSGDCADALGQVRLFGALAAGGAPRKSTAPAPGEVNLLSASAGGDVAPGTDASWKKIVSGKDDDTGRFSCASLPVEAVYKLGGKKTFSRFEILIPSSGQWVKGFELLAADDSPTGAFRSLGKFETQNARLFQTPYQRFTFAPATARYVKFKILSAYSGDCGDVLTQIRLMGK